MGLRTKSSLEEALDKGKENSIILSTDVLQSGKLDKYGKPVPGTPSTWLKYYKDDENQNIDVEIAKEPAKSDELLKKRKAKEEVKELAKPKKKVKKEKKSKKKAKESSSEEEDSSSSDDDDDDEESSD